MLFVTCFHAEYIHEGNKQADDKVYQEQALEEYKKDVNEAQEEFDKIQARIKSGDNQFAKGLDNHIDGAKLHMKRIEQTIMDEL